MAYPTNFFVLVLVVSLFFPVLFLQAHSSGVSYEAITDGYFIDVGQSESSISVGTPIYFDYSITKEGIDAPVEVSDIWLRINQGNAVMFAGSVHRPVIGPVGATYTFPEAGVYTMYVRFQNNGNSIVEHTIELVVGKGETEKASNKKLFLGLTVAVAVGLVIGFIFAHLVHRKKTA